MLTRLVFFAAVVVCVCSAAPASAELVFFTSGRTLSVKSHRTDGDSVVLQLRAGGEVVCESSLVAKITPDEVPYPEPEVAKAEPPLDAPEPLPAVPYGEIIDKVATKHQVDPKLVRALIQVESAYQPRARSPKGAMGLMQLMPATARQYSVDRPYEVESNIEGGIRYLRTLLDRFPSQLPLALAAYNAGEAAVARFGGIPPYRETRDYVARILQLIGH
jgi:hypothetical protein